MFSFSSPPHQSLYQRSTFPYTPQTPSPLRTSHNANRMSNRNIQSSPLSESTSYTSIEQDENINIFSPEQTPKSFFTSTTPSTIASSSSKFAFDSTTPQNVASSSSLFAYESRARSSSPAAQLNKHATDSREKRKSMFLDRIRNRREDKRDDRMGDQILRMDYVRERKAWEEQKIREEQIGDLAEEPDEDMDMDLDMDMDMEAEPSPTEDKEIEELVSYLEEQERTHPPDPPSDDEYDQLFMELSTSQQDASMDLS